jgi:hypothetical protein
MRRSLLLSRIEKPRLKTVRRRRPSKKLATSLESLVGALPEITSEAVAGSAIITRASLKSRPGALKKRAALGRLEIERFNKNMTQLAGGRSCPPGTLSDRASAAAGPATEGERSQRWEALQGFIRATLDGAVP